MKILLINPSTPLKGITPSVGLTYIGTASKNAGYSVKVVDSNFMRINPYFIIENFKPRVIGIYCSTPNYSTAMKIAEFAKEKGSIVVVGGPHVSLTQEEVLKNNIFVDFGIIGEGEYSFLRLINSIDKNENLRKVPGLIFREGEKIIKNKPQLIKYLDRLPFPDYSLLGIKKLKYYPLLTSRGCPYACIFCCVPLITWKSWRARSPENVIKEIKQAKKKYKFKYLDVIDDDFSFDKDRIKKLCKLLISEKLGIKWRCTSGVRADKFDEELGILMKKSGCKYIIFGIESGDQKIFKTLNKGESLVQIEKSIKICKKLGINVSGFFIVGLPKSTKKSEEKSFRLMKRLKLNSSIWSIAIPFPGTKMYEMVKRNLIKNPVDSSMHYRFNKEPFFENKRFSKDEIRRAYIINNIKAGNYFTIRNLFLNLRYDLDNLPIHIVNISKEVIKNLLK